jgi:hypothetical protein
MRVTRVRGVIQDKPSNVRLQSLNELYNPTNKPLDYLDAIMYALIEQAESTERSNIRNWRRHA